MKLHRDAMDGGNVLYYITDQVVVDGAIERRKVRELGDLFSLMKKMNCTAEEVDLWARKEKDAESKKVDRNKRGAICIQVNPNAVYRSTTNNSYQAGYLVLQIVYYRLGIGDVAKRIQADLDLDIDLDLYLRYRIFSYFFEKYTNRPAKVNFLDPELRELHALDLDDYDIERYRSEFLKYYKLKSTVVVSLARLIIKEIKENLSKGYSNYTVMAAIDNFELIHMFNVVYEPSFGSKLISEMIDMVGLDVYWKCFLQDDVDELVEHAKPY